MTLPLPQTADDFKAQDNFEAIAQYLAGTEEALALAKRDAELALKAAAVQPAARVTKAAPQSIPNGIPGTTTLTFDTEDFDNADLHDNSTNPSRLTVPSDGLYLMEVEGTYAGPAGGGPYLTLYLNGGALPALPSLPVVWTNSAAVVAIRSLTAGDYIEGVTGQNSGAALNITASLAMARLSSVS